VCVCVLLAGCPQLPTMALRALRSALASRGLDNTGSRAVLEARLKQSLVEEEQAVGEMKGRTQASACTDKWCDCTCCFHMGWP
jgi:hypothetical protein